MEISHISMPGASLPVSRQGMLGVIEDLTRLIAPNEAAFIALGEALSCARSKLRSGGEQFRLLSERMDQGDGVRSARALSDSRDEIISIHAESREVAAELAALGQSLAAVGHPVAVLAKIIGEVAVLGTNAKIQAAQVGSTGIDFSVFTKDVDRLHGLAEEAMNATSARLAGLKSILDAICAESEAFHRGDAAELKVLAERLGLHLAALGERRDQARRALVHLERRSVDIGERVSRCIGALQVNDLTSQRIGHVQAALSLLSGLVDTHAAEDPDCAWIQELDEGRRRLLIGTVCTLQATQLERAAADFQNAVGELGANLRGLAADANATIAESQKVFGGEGAKTTFIHDVLADVHRAMDLLDLFCRTDESIRARIEALVQGFASMKGDLDAIRSIDADMRIMGLNATLKCSRLGNAGVALGVVAQELRACSRRTEETSRAIGAAIGTVSSDAAMVADRSAREREAAAAVAVRMRESVGVLDEFGQVLDDALAGMDETYGEVGRLLVGVGGELGIGRALGTGIASIAQTLRIQGHSCAGRDADPSLVREDIQRMLGQHYTMASERVIHELFADGNAAEAVMEQAAADGGGDAGIDSLFF